MKLTLTGIKGVLQVISSKKILADVQAVVEKVTRGLAIAVRKRTPVDTGTLRSSWAQTVSKLTGRVFVQARRNPVSGASTLEYGPIVDERRGVVSQVLNKDLPRIAVDIENMWIRGE